MVVVVDISRWRLTWLRCAAMWILGLAACNRCTSALLVGFMLSRQRVVPQQALVFGWKLLLSVVHLLLERVRAELLVMNAASQQLRTNAAACSKPGRGLQSKSRDRQFAMVC